MILKRRPFRRVAIIGVGLMGGSLGLAIKKHKLAKEVVGISARRSSLVKAVKCKAVDVAYTDIDQAVKGADLVVLATPVETIKVFLSSIKSHLKRGCVITDVGSTKFEIIEQAEKILPYPGAFIGSHPLVGSEKRGVENASADLYVNGLCIVTPTKKTSQVALGKVTMLWSKIGAKVKKVSPEEHDKILTYVSHLPHLLAYGLISTISEDHLQYGSTGLKDTTRIAASSPQMWSDICFNNSKNVVMALDQLVKKLALFRKAIMDKDERKLLEEFSNAKKKRDSIA